MNNSVGIIGGADGPTEIYVTAPIGHTMLYLFGLLMVALAVFVVLSKLTKKTAPFAIAEAILVLFVDGFTKLLVGSMELGETRPLLPGILRLQLVHNYGAAWSSFSGERFLLIGVTAVGIGALIFLALRIVRHPLGVWALWMVIAGGVGNLIDRINLGYVVDMLATEFMNFPVFNIADIFVTCGTVAAAIYYLKYYEKYDAKNWEKKTDGADRSDNGAV
jgi:signal peptidase II